IARRASKRRHSAARAAPAGDGQLDGFTAGRRQLNRDRTPPQRRVDPEPIHWLQMWVALPAAKEEMDAAFAHHETAEFPVVKDNGKNVRVVVGSLYGAASPVPVVHETIFGDGHLKAGSRLPLDPGHEERAIYVIDGVVDISGDKFEPGRLLVFKPADSVAISAVTDAHFVILSAAPMHGAR